MLHANDINNRIQIDEEVIATFYVIATNNILEVQVEAQLAKNCFRTTFTHRCYWGGVDVQSITSSQELIYLSVKDKADIITVNINNGHIRYMKYALKSVDYSPVLCLFYVDKWSRLYVSTYYTLYTLTDQGEYIYHEWIGGVLDTPPVDISFDSQYDNLWLAEKSAVHRLDYDGRIDRFGYHQGSRYLIS